jgi:putative transposase
MAKAYRKAHHRSANWARHSAISIVSSYGVISLEDLSLLNMTKSAQGTLASPGKGVAQKKGLNRSLTDAALGRLAYWTSVKAVDAGTRGTHRASVRPAGIPRRPTADVAASSVAGATTPNMRM